ncbi:stage III sporulation protein AD [Mahella australiensis]|uniref:Stage III sporulation protein AD n=1 Tax=Mahella australiensis (strain DSM 15567 / CIP 107919 / 50-1 BON) TaxID=697281 RepID=F4A172_MAHA5|nr:stage III sporulation protein AD [Mahella australiensis]AEE95975.1 stage III sporulation protein AD [Mahella australiensis 50-1 BON]
MDIVQIVSIGLVAAILAITLRQQRPEMALIISIAAGLVIFFMIAGKLSVAIQALNEIMRKAQLNNIYFTTVLKIIGIAYITEFGSQICKDAGEGSIASKIELAGKVLIMILALPIVLAVFDLISSVMQ